MAGLKLFRCTFFHALLQTVPYHKARILEFLSKNCTILCVQSVITRKVSFQWYTPAAFGLKGLKMN